MDVTGNGSIFWNATSFGADQEIYVTLAVIDPASNGMSVLLKSQSSSSANGGVIRVMYNPGAQAVQVSTYSGAQGWVQRGTTLAAPFANGDQLGAKARASGLVEIYHNGVLLGSRNASAWTYSGGGGYVGLWMANAANALLDDFGGGEDS
jgi:hypothetical protein